MDERRRLRTHVHGPSNLAIPESARGLRLWYAGCALMPATSVRLGSITVSDALFASAALVAIASPSLLKLGRHQGAWLVAAIVAFGALLASPGASGDELANFSTWARLAFIWTVWSLAATSVMRTQRQIQTSIAAFTLGCAASSLVALLQVALNVDVFGLSAVGPQQRAAGMAEHVNDQGGQLAVAVALSAAAIIQRVPISVVRKTALLACLFGLLASGSVSALFAAGVALAFALLRSARRPGRSLTLAMLGLLSGYLLLRLQYRFTGVTFVERFASATAPNSSTNSVEPRIRTLEHAWERITQNPFHGTGFDVASGGTFDSVTLTHNAPLLFLYQGGLLLLVALLIALGPPLMALFSKATVGPRRLLTPGVIAALAFAQTGPIMFQRYFWFPILLLMVAVTIDGSTRPRSPHHGNLTSGHRRTTPSSYPIA